MQHESSRSGSNAAALIQPTFTMTSPQRDPPSFAGLRGDDVEEWLDSYNRVSSFNRWDDAYKLIEVPFRLTKVAKTWFFNHREDFTDWDKFTSDLRRIFGTSSTGAEAAKKKLNERVQHPMETYTSYIEDVLALCRRVDGSMSEEDRVRHILKGITPFAFQALAVQNHSRVQDVIAACKRLEDLQSLRVQPAMWGEGFSKDFDLRAMIRQIIREELGHISHDVPDNHPQPLGTTVHAALQESSVPGLRDLIRDELAAIKSDPPCKAEHSCASPAASASTLPQVLQTSTPLTHVGSSCAHVAPISAVPSTPQSYSIWRPSRPVCYYCGIRGHISRFCRRRQQDERYSYTMNARRDSSPRRYGQPLFPPATRRSSPPPDSYGPPRTQHSPRRRSPSPYRRSSSPLRPASHVADRFSEN